jgi:hypothetical protein
MVCPVLFARVVECDEDFWRQALETHLDLAEHMVQDRDGGIGSCVQAARQAYKRNSEGAASSRNRMCRHSTVSAQSVRVHSHAAGMMQLVCESYLLSYSSEPSPP